MYMNTVHYSASSPTCSKALAPHLNSTVISTKYYKPSKRSTADKLDQWDIKGPLDRHSQGCRPWVSVMRMLHSRLVASHRVVPSSTLNSAHNPAVAKSWKILAFLFSDALALTRIIERKLKSVPTALHAHQAPHWAWTSRDAHTQDLIFFLLDEWEYKSRRILVKFTEIPKATAGIMSELWK